jgi:hypothetical protein
VAISLTIPVLDITATLAFGYTHIKAYRSAEQDIGFTEITTPSSLIPLVAGVSTYTFIDGSGTTEHWYLTAFVDETAVLAESAASAAFRGDYHDTNFSPITYPEEAVFTPNDRYCIDRLRTAVGDAKELTRDYISVDTGYSTISIDGGTHTLSNPSGWPLRILLDGTEYTTTDEPRVNDYKFITFSGTTIATPNVLDIWYYHFRNSDTELLRVFNSMTPPPGLTADQVPFELAICMTAVKVLEGELRLFGITSGSAIEIYQEISINPKGGVAARQADLTALRERCKYLLDEAIKDLGGAANKDIFGVLID